METTIADMSEPLYEEYSGESKRWADVSWRVFEHEGQYWRVDFYTSTGDEGPHGLDYYDDATEGTVTATLVEPYEVTVTKYRTVA
jgi:hypothetical protein